MARDALDDPSRLSNPASKSFTDEEIAAMHESALYHVDVDAMDGPLIAKLALEGDTLALKVIQRAAYYLSLGMVNVVMMFAPEMIVLGGGVMDNHELFIPAIHKAIQELSPIVPADKVQIRLAKLGPQAGMYGGAYSIVQRL
jgi:glucokinase